MTTVPGTLGNQFLTKVRQERKHQCADIHYEHGSPADLAPVICSCGWETTVENWSAHAPGLSVSRAYKDESNVDRRDMRGRKFYAGPSLHMPDARVLMP